MGAWLHNEEWSTAASAVRVSKDEVPFGNLSLTAKRRRPIVQIDVQIDALLFLAARFPVCLDWFIDADEELVPLVAPA